MFWDCSPMVRSFWRWREVDVVQMEKTLKPAVVVMNLAMPLLNGWEEAMQVLATQTDSRAIIF
jgi:hypothetical protein